MNKILRKSFVVFILMFGANSVWGQGRAPSGRHSYGLSALAGMGKMGNGDDVPDRKMNYVPVAIFYGYNWARFRLGGQVEYQLVNQMDAPADFSNQNLAGAGTSIGIRLDYYDGQNSFGAIVRPYHSYVLQKTTLTGEKSTFKGNAGLSVQYYRKIKGGLGIVFDYTKETFSTSVAAPSGAVGYDRISLGLVLTNFKMGR